MSAEPRVFGLYRCRLFAPLAAYAKSVRPPPLIRPDVVMGWLSDVWKYGFTAAQRARSRGVERYVQAIAAYERELAGLPAREARAAAERVLAAPGFTRGIPWRPPPPPHPELAPVLGEFFRTIQRVEVRNGERYADLAELAPFEWGPGYLRLGTDG